MSVHCRRVLRLAFFTLILSTIMVSAAMAATPTCGANDPHADVVALAQPFTLNRIGAWVPSGSIYALKGDVIRDDGTSGPLEPGHVQLRADRRPRPLVLRVNWQQCLTITLWNMLPPGATGNVTANGQTGAPAYPATRAVGLHVNGLEVTGPAATGVNNDSSFVGRNDYSLVNPGQHKDFRLYAAEEGTFLMYSMGANFDQQGAGATFMAQATGGIFGSVSVEPPGGEYYRSQVTREDLLTYAIKRNGANDPVFAPNGDPEINYQARYPATHPTRACMPVLRMVAQAATVSGGKCVASGVPQTFYGDLTAIITGPNTGNFVADSPSFNKISASPDRRHPYREFAIHYHELSAPTQAFNAFNGSPTCKDPSSATGANYPITGTNPALVAEAQALDNDANSSMAGVLTPGSDLFAINYGTGGIAAEILANRYKIGPETDCVDCKFEEFFLTSWAVGDPASVSDVLANQELVQKCQGLPVTPPTKVLFPDDPSNVYHSYLNDHVKFRVLHAGADLTHVHHQHAQQWLHSPNENDSTYLDSQMISPGSAYTLEIDYGGSGNRNRTIGDSIFHCHFYPHFAAGMWSMWRVHDVFEAGTQLDANGVAVLNARAQPDGEIVRGTVIPALVPVPTNVMPPLPAYAHLDVNGRTVQHGGICNGNKVDGMALTTGTCTNGQTVFGTALLNGKFTKAANQSGPGNSGYPFFIPGIAGSRPPHPPLDFACELDASGHCKLTNGKPNLYDGGLPRHVIASGTVLREHHNVWDFTKDNDALNARELPEDGTPAEKAAIAYNGTCHHSSFTPLGVAGDFRTNGLPNGPQHGAPFADPAVHEDCTAAGTRVVRYKAANVQTDVVFSKKGWHYPQQRFITLWDDVAPTLAGGTLAQPFFFRANSKQDVIEYWLANLVPTYYALDNFQVRTPTDILGQHIHLVKFDVLASDGAGNGFNYEDGTLSYQEVTERIEAINHTGGIHPYPSGAQVLLTPKSIPELDPTNKFPGAQATVQRWYPDPLLGSKGDPLKDRTIRTVFTHDHFGPSTHQQAGLYAGLLVEPEGSTWTKQDGTPMKTRADGGPTSWDARILHGTQSYREFALEFQDLSLAYTAASIQKALCYPSDGLSPASPDVPNCTNNPNPYPSTIAAATPVFGWADTAAHAINPATANATFLTNPTIISGTVFTGTLSVNYRNEPLALRVNNGPNVPHNPTDPQTDLAYAFASIKRADGDLNEQPAAGSPINPPAADLKFNAPFPGAGDFDPYTPLLRAYQGDPVQVRVLVGGYLYNHNFAFHGVHWLFEPSALDSGWRDNQGMGISEHFEFLFKAPVTKKATTTQPCLAGADPKIFCADYLYTPGAGQWDLAQGLWGIMRTYNLGGGHAIAGLSTLPNNTGGGNGMAAAGCPGDAHQRNYFVKAIADSPLTFNDRLGTGNKIVNPTPLRYVLTDASGTPLSTDKTPLVLRANAGDCVNVTLTNAFPTPVNPSDFYLPVFTQRDQNIPGFSPLGASSTSGFFPSTMVGMHPQLLTYDVTSDQGMNVGLNPVQTVAPGGKRTYHWYAGNVDGATHTPIEFGSSTIINADTIEQPSLSMLGAFVTEPKGSTWPTKGELHGDVKLAGTTLFREFVNVLQNNAYLYPINALPPKNVATFFNAMNYTSNSMGYRFGGQNGANPPLTTVISDAFSNTHPLPSVTPPTEWGDPLTVWVAEKGKPVRLRMVHPDGLGGFPDDVIKLHGHVWSEEPYTAASASLGTNTAANWIGGRDGFGAGNHFDILLKSAGGAMAVPGDYLLASFPAAEQANGNWGLLRVCDPANATAFPCTTSPIPPTNTTVYPQQSNPPRYAAPPATGSDRFFLRTPAVINPTATPAPPAVPVPSNNSSTTSSASQTAPPAASSTAVTTPTPAASSGSGSQQ